MWVNALGHYINHSAVLVVTRQVTLQFWSLKYGIRHINIQNIRRCRHHNHPSDSLPVDTISKYTEFVSFELQCPMDKLCSR